MTAVAIVVYDNQLQRKVSPGDIITSGEVILALANAAGVTLTGAQVSAGILSRSGPGAAVNDTLPAATDLIAAILNTYFTGSGALNANAVTPGTTFRLRYINNAGFAITLLTNTGVTLGANTVVAASSVKEYLLTVTNGTVARTVQGNVTNASLIITGMDANQLQYITQGMLVTGTGIPAGATIASVQPGVGITLSAAATATNVGVALAFSPTYSISSLGQMLL